MVRWGGWRSWAGSASGATSGVLDAGCGSGRVTEVLLERLPRGSVVALDLSPAMLDEAKRRLARFGDRVEYVRADLARPLPVRGRVDAVLSTATFHWVPDHDAPFRNLAAVLRPGGRLAAQCGAAGNIRRMLEAAARAGVGWEGPGGSRPSRRRGRGSSARGSWTSRSGRTRSPRGSSRGMRSRPTSARSACGRVERLPPARRDGSVRRPRRVPYNPALGPIAEEAGRLVQAALDSLAR